MRNVFFVATATGLILASGCSRETILIETEINSDGTIARATTQPDNDTLPESGRTGWQKVRIVSETALDGPPPDKLSDDVPVDPTYLKASGAFRDAASIPNHFVSPSADGSVSGELKRDYKRTDYGFFVEHTWTEELTDPVQPTQIPTAAKALTAFLSLIHI